MASSDHGESAARQADRGAAKREPPHQGETQAGSGVSDDLPGMDVKQAQPQFWPFGDRAAVLSVPLILAVLFIAVISAKAAFNWPTPGADGLVLTGVLVLSLLPLALNLIDRLAARGGSFEYAGLRIDFAAALQPGTSITIATNIGVPGTPIPDSGSISILETLNTAV